MAKNQNTPAHTRITRSPDHPITRFFRHPITRSPDHPILRHPILPRLVAYVTCGDPNLATTREIVLAAIAAGADVIELGVPFSDPVADGPVIQRASQRALEHGTTLADVLKLAAEVRQHAQSTGMIIFSYLN